jgi:branched-chain amino acid transport system substrate-binding protein
MIMKSVKLYFDQHKTDGLTIKLIPIDDKSNPADAVSALQAVAADPQLVGLIAFYNSSTALAGKPILQEAQMPTLIYSASNPKVTDDAPYYFRLVPTDDNQAIGLSDYAKKLGAKKAAILYYADEYGKGLADGIQARAGSDGYQIVSVQSYDTATTDFRPVLTVVKGKNPDVVFICGFVEKSIAILNQAAERGLKSKFLAGDGTFDEQQLMQGAGKNAEGLYVAAPYVFDETNEKNKSFLDAYWTAYEKGGSKQKPASWTAFAYDAAGILETAFRAGHRDRASIHQFLKDMNSPQKGYDGITGLTYFNPKGDAVGRQFRLAVVKNQQFAAAN